jgi:glycogen phosphorylase
MEPLDTSDTLWLLPLALLGSGLAFLMRGLQSAGSELEAELKPDPSPSNSPSSSTEQKSRSADETSNLAGQEAMIEITDESTASAEMNSTNDHVLENTNTLEEITQHFAAEIGEDIDQIGQAEAEVKDEKITLETTESTLDLETMTVSGLSLADSRVGDSEIEASSTEPMRLPDENGIDASVVSTQTVEEVALDSENEADAADKDLDIIATRFPEALTEAERTEAALAQNLPEDLVYQAAEAVEQIEKQENAAEQATVSTVLVSEDNADTEVERAAEQANDLPNPVAAEDEPMAKIIPIETRQYFDIRTFQQALADTLYYTQHKTLQSAMAHDFYTALASMVQARLLQFNPIEQMPHSKMRVEISPEFALGLPLESHLINLGLLDLVRQGLQDLGLDLNHLCEQETLPGQGEDGLGCLVGSDLESFTTANLAAIGYGLYYAHGAAANEENATRSIWQLEQCEASVEVKFGGYTEFYTDEQGHYRKRWVAEETVQAVPQDLLISGYETESVNRVRLWKTESAMLHQPYDPPAINSSAQQQELSLKQCFLLASCAVQDMIRLHLAAEQPIETLPDRFQVQLNDAATVLTLAELMHQLVDEHQIDWEQAWSITQTLCSCRLYHLTAMARGERWSIDLLNRLFPRHLEIINEINRRFLDQVRHDYSQDEERIRRMSLIDETVGLRAVHLACVGSYSITGAYPLHTQLIQRTLLFDFNELYSKKFRYSSSAITPRRFLLQSSPRLANLITQWLGNIWITRPEQLQQLAPLVNNVKFCGGWWDTKRAAKQDLIHYIQQRTGITVNLNSLFDVQAMPIEANKRQLLNLLHIITLYARLKTNASTDTIQRFAHRSVPRTCIFVGEAAPNNTIAASIVQLIRAVAEAINGDPDVQGRLQVVCLEDNSYQTVRHVYAATDLAEQIPLADQDGPSLVPLQFALNGAITIGTPNSANLELRQAVGANNLFLFGMTATEAERLNVKYDPWQFYDSDPELKQALDLIVSGYFSYGDSSVFKAFIEWFINNDPNLVLADYQSYMNCQERISQVYQDQKNWTWMSILNVAHMGKLFAEQVG